MEQLELPFGDSLDIRVKKYNEFIYQIYYKRPSLTSEERQKLEEFFGWPKAYELRKECGVRSVGTFFIKKTSTSWERTYERP